MIFFDIFGNNLGVLVLQNCWVITVFIFTDHHNSQISKRQNNSCLKLHFSTSLHICKYLICFKEDGSFYFKLWLMQHLLTILLLSGDHWVLLLMFNHTMQHSHFGWIRKYDIQTICIMKTLVLMSFQIVCNLQSVRECPTPNYTYHYYHCIILP